MVTYASASRPAPTVASILAAMEKLAALPKPEIRRLFVSPTGLRVIREEFPSEPTGMRASKDAMLLSGIPYFVFDSADELVGLIEKYGEEGTRVFCSGAEDKETLTLARALVKTKRPASDLKLQRGF